MNWPIQRFAIFFSALLALASCLAPATAVEPQLTVLHHFDEATWLHGNLVLNGSTLYGTTPDGGVSLGYHPHGGGLIYSIGTDGNDYSPIHLFSQPEGVWAPADVVSDGERLYGTTLGSTGGEGSVFSIGFDGTGLEQLHNFTAIGEAGTFPIGGLTLMGTTLYGTTTQGTPSHQGAVYSIETDGSGLNVIREFSPTGSGNCRPPVMVNSILYGLANGGSNAWGEFTEAYYTAHDDLAPDGHPYHAWVYFTDRGPGPSAPIGSLVVHESRLFGMTREGGQADLGALIALDPGEPDFFNVPGARQPSFDRVVHDFLGGPDDGAYPVGTLALDGSTFYGVTAGGGEHDLGVVFSIEADGTDFTLLHSFTGGLDGATPDGPLLLDGTTLYGTALFGGQTDEGVLFALDLAPIPEPSTALLLASGLALLALAWGRSTRKS